MLLKDQGLNLIDLIYSMFLIYMSVSFHCLSQIYYFYDLYIRNILNLIQKICI